jgi:hypothetical protein
MMNWLICFFFTFPSLIFFNQGYSQKLHPFSILSNTYTGEINQSITVNKFVCDSLGNTFLYLKVQDKISVNETKVPDLLNDKTKAPSYQIIKLNKEGDYEWGISSQSPVADIACDSTGNLFFCSNDMSDTKNSKLIFYQSKTVIMTEQTNNILVKFSPDGTYLWSKKIMGDFYSPKSILKVGYDNKLYCLITKNGTRMMDHSIVCMDLNGREEWRTDIYNQYIDVFELAPDGKSYVAGYDFKVDDKKVVVYPFEIARYVLLEIDEGGTPKKLYDKKFDFNTEGRQRIDFYVNHISFDTANNPLFIFCTLIGPETPELNIANRSYKKEKGEFIFVQTNKKGEIVWDYQLKTGTNIGNGKASLNDATMGLKKNIGLRYTKNNTWLICTPTATSIPYKDKRYELLGKTDLIYFELEPIAKGNIQWISTAATGKQFQPTPNIESMSDSTFLVANLSNKPITNVQGLYTDLRRLEIKIKKKPKPINEVETEEVEPVEVAPLEVAETDSTEVDSTVSEVKEENTVILEVTENIETPVDSAVIEEPIIEETNLEIESASDSFSTEPTIEKEDPHALKVQLLPLPNQTMLLEITKVPDDTLRASRTVEVEVRDANGNNIFPREMELHNGKLQIPMEVAKWGRGVFVLTVIVGGKENAEMKIVRL